MSKKQTQPESLINDLDLKKWKDYDDLLVDSLWIIDQRDKSGAHSNTYHGNFVPQIPNQFIRRFSKKNEIVLDAFLGSGTTLIEAQRLGRNGIGIELLEDIANLASVSIDSEAQKFKGTNQKIIVGDSRRIEFIDDIKRYCDDLGQESVSLIFLHPPYHDIIKFSEDPNDLSQIASLPEFLAAFGDVVVNLENVLKKNGHIVIVIADKYEKSQWIPLGFLVMSEALNRCTSLVLKSTIIKNMSGNRAKINQERLWRYRALSGGYFVFKHEYIFLLKKIR